MTSDKEVVVKCTELSYTYAEKRHTLGTAPAAASGIQMDREEVLIDVNFQIEAGSRVLVVGGNGAGKSTLLSIIGGHKMIPKDKVLVFGRPAFHDTQLIQNVAYLGDWWKTDFFLNCRLREMLSPAEVESERVQHMAKVLAVNLDWIVNRVSDGQRRRCQLLIGLAKERQLYVLDEVTTDLDVIARDRLLQVLREESDRGATVLYATHIFDNLENWATHVVRLHQGKVTWSSPLEKCTPYQTHVKSGAFCPLYLTVRDWVQEDWNAREQKAAEQQVDMIMH